MATQAMTDSKAGAPAVTDPPLPFIANDNKPPRESR